MPKRNVASADWVPAPNQCHDNVSEWTGRHPEFEIVQGWLCFELATEPYARFVAHSVVSSVGGGMMDITPTDIDRTYPFLAAKIPEEDYDNAVLALWARHGAANLDYWR